MGFAVIIVAAGRGVRAGPGLPKQYRQLAGRSVLAHTLAAFASHPGAGPIVTVLHPEDAGLFAAHVPAALARRCLCVSGGATREASVRAGLEALARHAPSHVLIHDAARPLVSHALIDRVCAALARHAAAAPALAVTDALWRGAAGHVAGVQDRAGLYRAQTPQGFAFGAILAAHRAHPGGAADDVEVARAAGLDVAIVAGEDANLKITAPGDFDRALKMLEAAMDVRTGTGFDVHRFGAGNHVTLCGVEIAHPRGLEGHSDADVAMHALTDAIYGALAEGDIGTHFPPSDPQWRGAASRIFLEHASGRARARGFRVTHVDVTLICEAPKIGPHAGAMRDSLAAILGLEAGRVSVKATTSERLGFTGREEGIAAMASATLVSAPAADAPQRERA
jgi:2-C-methyl-D-erythritol 4-phosphate cytidylyltransferase/2-C-methyl-D-erythritol 2,4-cyclodiphosphate synthase